MSRTYRRKNDQWDIRAYDWGYDDDGHFTKIFVEKNSKEYKKIKADFHRDHDRFLSGVPSWFVTMFREKPLRRKTKQIIVHWMKNPVEDGCVIPEFIKDAGWYYY
jgi:hypothetical protein